jgi:hypothetical protein
MQRFTLFPCTRLKPSTSFMTERFVPPLCSPSFQCQPPESRPLGCATFKGCGLGHRRQHKGELGSAYTETAVVAFLNCPYRCSCRNGARTKTRPSASLLVRCVCWRLSPMIFYSLAWLPVPGQLRCVTGGADGCVKIWSDLQVSTQGISPAHSAISKCPHYFHFHVFFCRVTAPSSTTNIKRMRFESVWLSGSHSTSPSPFFSVSL